jgi:hypothetical protein
LISSMMRWLGPAPAHANDAFAGLHALGEALCYSGHGTVAGEVGVIFGAEAFDDIGACGLVVGVAQDERISEDAVLAIDVDGDLAGLGLAGGARAFVSEAISIGEVGESCGRRGVLGLGVGRMGCASDDGHCLLSSGVVSGPGPDFVLNLCPSARPVRGQEKSMRVVRAQRSEPRPR